ncbi:hypothetical protein [Chthonobacter albigriseus]|uniref:hypothetical protein n=1 Tax=Chthonobacter albigriseus TaxID=1683161 RepID=UPI0015EFB6E9|nr:hypothetical protein [Chthonobacter albigriseus]
MHKSHRAMTKSGTAAAAAAADTMTTLVHRMPILFAQPSAENMTEWNRAIAEKVTAGCFGAFYATLAAQSMAMRMAAGMVAWEMLPLEMLRISDAATEPGYRTVAANAKRLARPVRR